MFFFFNCTISFLSWINWEGDLLFSREMQLAVLASTVLVTAGRAYVTAVPVTPGSTVRGVRIYDVKPILIVNGETYEIKTVPNYNRAYALRFGAFLAKNEVKVTLKDGIPSQIDANMDTTAVIELLKQALDKIPQTLSGPAEQARGGIQDRFQVFDFVFDEMGELQGLRPLVNESDLLRVTTTRRTAAAATPVQTAVVIPQPVAPPQASSNQALSGGPASQQPVVVPQPIIIQMGQPR